MEESDVLRIAAHLLAEHGDKAIVVARERAKALLKLGNSEAAGSWQKVAAAVDELSRKTHHPNESLH